MATRFTYACDSCGRIYVEQRADSELNPYFTQCHGCGSGTYVEQSAEPVEEIVSDQAPTE